MTPARAGAVRQVENLVLMLTHGTEVTVRLLAWLDAAQVRYRVIEHEPVFTSEQAAQVRGTSPESGAKALLLKADDSRYVLLVIAGSRRADNTRLRDALGTRRVRFASPEELMELTGCLPGALPPFGALFGLPVLLDRSLETVSETAFNAGSRAVSVVMGGDDFRRVLEAHVVEVAEV